jgi:hypothetical protein
LAVDEQWFLGHNCVNAADSRMDRDKNMGPSADEITGNAQPSELNTENF